MVPNSAEICTAILLSYLLITPRELELKYFFLSDILILALFVNILTAKYVLCYSENLQQSNQMQLSKKKKVLCEVSALFLISTSSFEY